MKRILISIAAVLIFPGFVFALELPQYKSFVNDFAGILEPFEQSNLETSLSNFEKETGNEIVVAIVPDLQETTVEDFAEKLFQKWGIGKKEKDNGILFLISIGDRKARFEIGYGLEGAVTDGTAGYILDHEVIPNFKNGNYPAGIQAGVNALIAQIKKDKDYAALAADESGFSSNYLFNLTPFFFFLIPIVFSYAASFLGRSRRIWPGGAIGLVGGGIAGYAIGLWIFAAFLGISLGLFGLLLDYIVSRNYTERKRKGLSTDFWHSGGGFWFGGRGGFGGGSGGGGFGGFGGGSSGGGGSSRGW